MGAGFGIVGRFTLGVDAGGAGDGTLGSGSTLGGDV